MIKQQILQTHHAYTSYSEDKVVSVQTENCLYSYTHKNTH